MLNSFYDKFIFTNGLKFRHNNFFLIDLPFLIMPVSMVSSMLSVDDPEFQRKIYLALKEGVKKNLMKDMSLEFGFKGEKLVEFLREYFSSSGWGAIRVLDINFQKTEAIICVSDNPFVSSFNSAPKFPVDSFLRGIFAGIFSKAFEKDVDCVELHCSALGAPSCEFVVKEQQNFDLSNKTVRQQLELDL